MRKVWLAGVAVVCLGWIRPAMAAAGPIPHGRLGLGDSIMRSAADEFLPRRIRVNAEVGRQFEEGLRILRNRARDGTLPKRVIVHLGTNGWIDRADCEALAEAAGTGRRVFLVTVRVPRDWMRPNNLLLRACAEGRARVHLIRWAMVSGPHPEWFADDGYHLNGLGQEEFAEYVDRRVDAVLAAVQGAG